jgi:flagellar M-ring protein FliF
LLDRHGNRYLDSGNPSIGDASRNRAREEDLVERIKEKLDWIKGVRVQVKVNSPLMAEPAAAQPSAGNAPRQPVAPEQISSTKTGTPTLKPQPDMLIPAMRVNQPPTPDPDLEPALPAAAVTASGTSTNRPGGAHSGEHEPQRKQEPGRVLIYVPRSFYLNADIRPDKREPTLEELHSMAERTESQIQSIVSLVTPSTESWKVDILTIPDEVSLSRPVNLNSSVDARRRVLDWGIVGTVVAVVSILAAVGSWIQVVRRPVVMPEPALQARRYHADTASEPGPSERVRELVRRNPEAAASVLQRWTGQGGRV